MTTPTRRRRSHKLLVSLLLILLGASWIMFAPLQFGGQTAYVLISGNSMEPVFHRGDLAILRTAAEYQLGDIVTYHHPTIGPVIHRIIGQDGDHFTFKGDHNSWADAYQPSRADLIGKLWIYLPGAGTLVEQLRRPWHMAIIAAFMGVIVMTTGTSSVDQRRWRRVKHTARATPRATRFFEESGGDLLVALAALAFASFLLGLFAFTRPTTRTVADDISYTQSGVFSYSAAATPGVYDSNTVQTGEPVFLRLTDKVAVNFAYRLTAEQAAASSGTYRLVAEIGDDSGWQRTIALQPETTFDGRAFSTTRVIDLAAIRRLIDQFEQQTSIQSPQYTLAVVPYVAVQGSLAGQELHDEFAPRLEFRLDRLALRLTPASDRATNALAPTKTALLKHTRSEPNSIALLGLTIAVGTARRLALIGATLGLDGIVLLALLRFRVERRSVVARIRSRYGARLIAVHDQLPQPGARVVIVARIEDLAKLAERTDRAILHATRGACHCYAVQDSDATYCYQVTDDTTTADAAPEEQPE